MAKCGFLSKRLVENSKLIKRHVGNQQCEKVLDCRLESRKRLRPVMSLPCQQNVSKHLRLLCQQQNIKEEDQRVGKKKRRVQTANLFHHRDVATQTEPIQTAFIEKIDCGTNTGHDRLNQPAGRHTAADEMVAKSHAAYDRLQSCTKSGFHWKTPMIFILLQFVFYNIYYSHDTLTATSLLAATMFKIKQASVLKLTNMYLQKVVNPVTTDFWPSELPQKNVVGELSLLQVS